VIAVDAWKVNFNLILALSTICPSAFYVADDSTGMKFDGFIIRNFDGTEFM